jgi:hypothetical protein
MEKSKMQNGMKPSQKDRVAEKTGWFMEQYFQTYEMVSKDPRYKQLPQFNQTSMLATVFIATNAALDKIRDAKQVAKKLEEISESEKNTKVA